MTTGPSGDEQIRLPVALSKAVQRPFKAQLDWRAGRSTK